jgi:HK97 gp10 family phage protein
MTIAAGDEFAIQLSKLGADEDIAKKAIYEGANILADKIKSNLEGVLSKDASGELIESFGIAPINRDDAGNWNTKIGFDGYDSNWIANQLKARVIESGSSKQKAKPFVRPAVNATKKQIIEKMNQVIDQEIKKLNL